MKGILVFTALIFSLVEVLAQNCSKNLEDATRAYYNGQFRDVSPKLEGCIAQLPKEEKTDALKLLVDTHLLLGETQTADYFMRQLLSVNTDYKMSESDLAEFRNLYESYRVLSKYSIGLSVGPMRPDYRIIKHHSYSGVTEEPDDYNESVGFVIGLSGNLFLYKDFYFGTGIYYDQRGFEQEEIILGIQSVKSKEREHRLNVPLQVKYVYPSKKFRPYLGGGFSYHYLLNAEGDLEHFSLEPEVDGGPVGVPYSDDSYDLTHLRRRSTWNWLVSGGMQLIIQGGFILEANMMYERGFYNLIEEEKRFSDTELLEKFAYVPDDYKMSGWIFSVSILKNFSKPKKQ